MKFHVIPENNFNPSPLYISTGFLSDCDSSRASVKCLNVYRGQPFQFICAETRNCYLAQLLRSGSSLRVDRICYFKNAYLSMIKRPSTRISAMRHYLHHMLNLFLQHANHFLVYNQQTSLKLLVSTNKEAKDV